MTRTLYFLTGLIWVTSLFFSGCSAVKVISTIHSGVPQYSASAKNTTIPFTLKAHAILVDVNINNSKKTYRFFIDTGAMTVIDDQIAEQLQLPAGLDVNVKGSQGGKINGRLITLDDLRVENVHVKECAAVVFDLSLIGVEGILGSNFLRHFKIVLDYDKQRVTFSQNTTPEVLKDNAFQVEFKTDFTCGFAPKITCMVNNQFSKHAIIDTGFPAFLAIPMQEIDNNDLLQSGQWITAKGHTLGGAFANADKSYLLRIDEFSIGELTLHSLPAVSTGTSDILIGKAFLENYIVTLNYPAGQMILTPNNSHSFETTEASTSFGLAITKQEDGKVVVIGIWENSPADKKKIEIGDEIIMINSRQANTFSPLELMAILIDNQVDEISLVYLNGNGEQQTVTLIRKQLLPPAS